MLDHGILNSVRYVGLITFAAGACIVLTALSMQGADLYVSTNGTGTGSGTRTQPFDLATALSGQVGQPGDTFWLFRGDYRLGQLGTQIQGEAQKPITFRSMPGEKVRIDGSIVLFGTNGFVILRDFELYSSDTNRVSSQTGVGFNVTDISIIPGIASYSPNLSFINLTIHDQTRHGIYIAETSSNTLVYGCVIYNNGWYSPDNAEGHGLYVQGTNGTREISDNVVFNNSGANMHVYENAGGRSLTGVTLDGNAAFNAGAIQNVRSYRDWLVGADMPAVGADRILLKNNMGYYPVGSRAYDQVQIGRLGVNGSVALVNNYFPQGLMMNNWTVATVTSNVFAAPAGEWLVSLDQTQVSSETIVWDSNAYFRSADGKDFVRNTHEYDFAGWQSATGYDSNSVYTGNSPSGTKVFVRTNRYEPGRANIIIYNWENVNSVSVDVGSVLAPETPYEVRNAQDFCGAPVLSGVFAGQPLELPMRDLTVAAPNGPLLTAAPTGPTFNVFVLLPRNARLEMTTGGPSWPTNAGRWVLQFTEDLVGNGGWMDDTNMPDVRGDHYVVTNRFSQSAGFYRLRAGP